MARRNERPIRVGISFPIKLAKKVDQLGELLGHTRSGMLAILIAQAAEDNAWLMKHIAGPIVSFIEKHAPTLGEKLGDRARLGEGETVVIQVLLDEVTIARLDGIAKSVKSTRAGICTMLACKAVEDYEWLLRNVVHPVRNLLDTWKAQSKKEKLA